MVTRTVEDYHNSGSPSRLKQAKPSLELHLDKLSGLPKSLMNTEEYQLPSPMAEP